MFLARSLSAVVTLLLLGASHARPQLVKQWRSLSSPNFEIVSRYDPAKIRPLLEELEWARTVFETNFGWKSRFERRALILLPDNPFEFESVAGSQHVGFYFNAPWRDLIVVRELPGVRSVLLHEYTHLVVRHQGARYPAWLNEGLAEFFATMERVGTGVEAGTKLKGRPDPARFVWVPVGYLTSIGSATEIKSSDAMTRFYAQSWLFTHLIRLAPAYRERSTELFALLKEGVPTQEALQRVYGKSLVEFDKDAREWASETSLPAEQLKAPAASDVKVEETVIGEIEVEIVRATMGAMKNGASKTAADYARLSKLAGEGCGVQAALGDLAFAAGQMPRAGDHYKRAKACGLNASELNEHIAESLSYRKDVTPEEFQALTGSAGEGRTRMLLGAGHFFGGDYEGAMRELEAATKLNPYDEFRRTRMMALALSNLGKHAEAVAAAERLRELATEAGQRHNAALTIDDVKNAQQRSGGPSADERMLESVRNLYTRLEGTLIRVDCMEGRARFWIRERTATRKLLIADPSEVVTGPAGTELEFTCGDQRRSVLVNYQPETDAKMGTEGRIRYLEFTKTTP
jgi:tetratricopeptide (TPR) repeat protein